MEVGIYSIGFALSQYVRLIESSVGKLLFPFLSGHLIKNSFNSINTSIGKFERFSLCFILPLLLILILNSNSVIRILYGSSFVESGPIFAITSLSVYISIFSLPYGNLLFGAGYFNQSAIAWLIALCIFIICCITLVGSSYFDLSGIGISISLIISNIFLFMFYVTFIKKYLKQINILPSSKLLVYAFSYFSVTVIIYFLIRANILLNMTLSLLSMIVYWGLGYILNLFNKTDLEMLLEIINIKKLKDYISAELRDKKQ